MRIVDRKFIDKNIHTTRTRQHFGALLGEKPHVMGQVVRMYPRLTISNLTEGLRNVYTNKKAEGQFTPINSYAIQWRIDVNFIKKVRIAADATPTAGVFTVSLEEKYYNKNETFALENGTQLFIVAPPVYKGAKNFEHKVKMVSNNGGIPDAAMLKKGRNTRFRSNYHPELSVRGYVKYQFNTETHRNYLSKHRSSDVQSAEYSASQEYYIERGTKNAANGKLEYEYFRLQKLEKDVLESYLWARENHLLFGETNFDANGKCTMQDEKGQDIPIGDGVIKQIERYCEKFAYSVLTTRWLEDIMASMREKSANSIGNTYAFVVNERLYDQVGRLLKEDLRFISQNDGSYFYSKAANAKVKVGAEFDTYTFQGNTISFMPNRALSQEYPDHGYGIFLDTGADLASGRPNVAMFTLKGSEMISGTLIGMGGVSGNASGEITTSVHGSQYHLLGYSGSVVFNPYKSFLLEEARTL